MKLGKVIKKDAIKCIFFNYTTYNVAGGDRMKKNLLNKKKIPLYICPCTELTTGVVFGLQR